MYKSIFFFSALILFNLGLSFSQSAENNLSEEKGLYEKVANVTLNTATGKMPFSEVYDQSPVILTMIFTNCTGICSPFLSNLSKEVRKLGRGDYKVVVVSFDPADSLEHMRKLSERYSLQNNAQWIFATSDQIDSLNQSIDFHPIWDEERQQFDHEALLVGINMNGYITKKLLGMRDDRALLSVIKDINNEFILSYPEPGNEASISCFSYDPRTGERTFSFGFLFMIFPAIVTIGLVFFLANRSKKKN